MRQRLLLMLVIVLCTFSANATHIVGGEFELEYLSGDNYRLTLNLYFDQVHGDPGALDPTITVNVFEKAGNRWLGQVTMSIKAQSNVPYTNIECAIGELQTRKIVYYETIVLNPQVFNHPDGYYVTWERCCRNETINNIVAPEDAAQTFYMEFPAVTKSGQAFRNSSPKLFPPLSDYACVNELFYFDFSGSDADGDSLAYDMITPLNGFTNAAMPYYGIPGFENIAPKPAPYPQIEWLPGYSTGIQVQGNPPINIDNRTGRLTMRPTKTGLYVFGIRVQEFRNKKKIGEVRRDFQVLVLNCPTNQTPKVTAREQGKNTFYNEGEVLKLTPTGNRCIDVFFTDPDLSEFVVLKAIPVNFSATNFTLSGALQGVINQGGGAQETLKATLCFDDCFDTKNKVYMLDLIVQDDGCSLPRQDTLRVSYKMEDINNIPTLTTNPVDQVINLDRGQDFEMDVFGRDIDLDSLSLSAAGEGFDMTAVGMVFTSTGGKGAANGNLKWTAVCNSEEEAVRRVTFRLKEDDCFPSPDQTKTIEFRITAPNNAPTLTSDKAPILYELNLNEPFEANLFGDDIDLDPLQLTAVGDGFNLADLGMTFTATPGNGQARGVFNLIANCQMAERDVVRVNFILDEQTCNPAPEPVLSMEFKVKVPLLRDFIPANIFTPNGDGLNDFFEIPNLPSDFCTAQFASIKVFNRWGKEVYFSAQNNFKWDGKGVNDGVYFYLIDFGSTQYKGSVTIVR
ncbi:gliding motility-associated C-terminal domain-containing protein [Pontibacter sp. KCTC 32443]|uniref:gliding motility-associated C-terminal domain-containing protein n=1 Tax=Pontibacter TaxID=323449 RepID=UPI00164DA217|nr:MULTISPECIES: gliding motility-associated C-terminal domain-containing protein [Pontibacter]MBC5773214.1 gliding motility-associated C-terminal domain-containing protein [Pontibacter sp. KCTC 32443]